MDRGKTVLDIIEPNFLECSASETLRNVARLMSERACRSILVVEDDQALGIWTESDVLKVDLSGIDPSSVLISEVMCSPVKTIPSNRVLDDVVIFFNKHRTRNGLVLDRDGTRLGIITQSSLALGLGLVPSLKMVQVSQIVTSSPMIAADLTLIEAAKRMRAYRTDAILVMFSSDEIGVLSQRELIRALAMEKHVDKVSEIASPSILTVQYDETIYNAGNSMVKLGFSHLGVTDHSGRFIGMISFSDVLKTLEVPTLEALRTLGKDGPLPLEPYTKQDASAENIIKFSKDGIMITDKDGMIQSVNLSFTRMMGYAPKEIIGRDQSIFNSDLHDEDFYKKMWKELKSLGHWRCEIWSRDKNGHVVPHDLSISRIPDKEGKSYFYAAIYRDISALKKSEEEVRKLAFHDPLTGLANRRSIENRLERKLATGERRGKFGALLYIDLDQFKLINDSLGHAVGDALLVQVGDRLTKSLREEDTPARYGGDEFLVLLPELGDEMKDAVMVAQTVAEKIEKAIRTPYLVNGHRFILGASIGVSMFPEGQSHFRTIIKEGDIAMYRAKKSKGKVQFFNKSRQDVVAAPTTLEKELQTGLDKKEFSLHYQPQSDDQGKIIGMEALLRWNHPEHGLTSPYKLLTLEERGQVMVPVGLWVLREACRQLKSWSDLGIPFQQLSVNIDEHLFLADQFVAQVQQIVQKAEIDPKFLIFEVTERVVFKSFEESFKKMKVLKQLGFRFNIDDFGIDRYTLNGLKLLPLDKIKVDYRYIRDLYHDPHNSVLVQTIVAIAQAMEFEVIAGGIETKGQMETLQKMGCRSFQGHFFCHALPPEEITELLLAKSITP